MADDTLEVSYPDMLDRIAGGVRRNDDRWPEWYAEARGDTLEERIRDTFNRSGNLPSQLQFSEAQTAAQAEQDREDVVEEEPQEAAPAPKTTKKASS